MLKINFERQTYISAFFSAFIAIATMLLAATSLIAETKSKVIPQPTLDPRLPPVIPGEEVNRNGKKIKVWSTSGSPSYDSQDEKDSNSEWVEETISNPEIIVDSRKRRDR